MLFRLDFKQTSEGKFLVDAHASNGPTRPGERRDSAAVLYSSAETFLDLIRTAELAPGTVAAMEQAVRASTEQTETSVCCQEIDLSATQLTHLNLDPARDLYR